jgi:hypothetical protein
MISSNEKLAFHRIPAGMMEVIRRRWYETLVRTYRELRNIFHNGRLAGRFQGHFACDYRLLA